MLIYYICKFNINCVSGLGMAFGCFFEKNETVYAFSMQSEDMIGMVKYKQCTYMS